MIFPEVRCPELIRKAALNASAGRQKMDMTHEIEIVTDKKWQKLLTKDHFVLFKKKSKVSIFLTKTSNLSKHWVDNGPTL